VEKVGRASNWYQLIYKDNSLNSRARPWPLSSPRTRYIRYRRYLCVRKGSIRCNKAPCSDRRANGLALPRCAMGRSLSHGFLLRTGQRG
jgi:hypothetical protein